MKGWLPTRDTHSVNPTSLLFELIFHVFEGNRLQLFRMKNKIYVVAEGAAKVAGWEENDGGKFTVPIHEADINESFYLQSSLTF